jgi:hypothetical protein
MRAITRIVGGLAVTAALAVAGGTMASADNGDGQLACNSGEICFAEHAGGGGGQRHFYYGSSAHGNEGNFSSGTPFWHNASSIKNRDTVSAVCVTESGDWVNDSWQFPSRSTTWSNFANDLNDENNSHKRAAC